MTERRRPVQLGFEETREHTPGATHTILPGAMIKVQTKSGRGLALAQVVDEQFDAHRPTGTSESPSEKPRHLFVADDPFTVWYQQHNSRVKYPVGTRFYAFLSPQDKTVKKISPKQ